MSLEQDIARAARELREEQRIERLGSRHILRCERQYGRRPALIHDGGKARK